MKAGVRLCFDVGSVRIGVAKSDAHGLLAVPVETITVTSSTDGRRQALARALELVSETDAAWVFVGLPLNLQGHDTPSTTAARTFAGELARALFVREDDDASTPEVRLIDERLSTNSAHAQLRQAGRSTRQSRTIIDQQAAVVILEHALDMERSLGTAPGILVAGDESL